MLSLAIVYSCTCSRITFELLNFLSRLQKMRFLPLPSNRLHPLLPHPYIQREVCHQPHPLRDNYWPYSNNIVTLAPTTPLLPFLRPFTEHLWLWPHLRPRQTLFSHRFSKVVRAPFSQLNWQAMPLDARPTLWPIPCKFFKLFDP